MAIAERELGQKTKILTYEDYLNEREIRGRYDIIDGVRYWMPSPLDSHQDIVKNIFLAFSGFQQRVKTTRAYFAPIDILIQQTPLRVRQPDVMLVSSERYMKYRQIDTPPWKIGPELAVEVISPSNTKRSIPIKMKDYASVSVREEWIVYPKQQKIEQWQLSATDAPALIGTFTEGQTIASISFPGLSIDVSSVFEF